MESSHSHSKLIPSLSLSLSPSRKVASRDDCTTSFRRRRPRPGAKFVLFLLTMLSSKIQFIDMADLHRERADGRYVLMESPSLSCLSLSTADRSREFDGPVRCPSHLHFVRQHQALFSLFLPDFSPSSMPQYSFLAAAVPNSVAVEETAAASDAKGAVKAAADRLNQTPLPSRRARRKLTTIGRISPTEKTARYCQSLGTGNRSALLKGTAVLLSNNQAMSF